MINTIKRISLLLALGACLAAAGCGSDDEEGAPIPSEQVQLLERRLVETENRLADGSAGACEDILDDTQPEVGRLLDSLPEDVDPDVRSALDQSFANLWDLVQGECEERAAQEDAAQPEPEPEPEPEQTTETTEPEPEPQPEPEETIPTDPGEAPIPPDGDGESGGVIPEGNGGGGVAPGSGGEGGE